MNTLVKEWCELDSTIKMLSKQMKEAKQARDDISETLINEMKTNNIDSIDLRTGEQLVFKMANQKSGLSTEYIHDTLIDFFKLPHTKEPNALAAEATDAINNNREITEVPRLRKVKTK